MLLTSIIRRYRRTDRLSLRTRIVIRACSNYILLRIICEIFPKIDTYV
jgi:hypothetical protein